MKTIQQVTDMHAQVVRTVDAVIGNDGKDQKIDSVPALLRAMSLGHVANKALASRVKALATALIENDEHSTKVAETIASAIALWRGCIIRTVSGSKEVKDIRNSATYAITVLAKQTGTDIKWVDGTQSYSVAVAHAEPKVKPVTAAGTGKGAAQDAVKVDQLGAGLKVISEAPPINPLSGVSTDELIAELAGRFHDKAEFLIRAELLPVELFCKKVAA